MAASFNGFAFQRGGTAVDLLLTAFRTFMRGLVIFDAVEACLMTTVCSEKVVARTVTAIASLVMDHVRRAKIYA